MNNMSILSLPTEILRNIAQYLSKEDAYAFAEANRSIGRSLWNFKAAQYSEFWQKVSEGAKKYFIEIQGFNPDVAFSDLSFEEMEIDEGSARSRKVLNWMKGKDCTTLRAIGEKGERMARMFLWTIGVPQTWKYGDYYEGTWSSVYNLYPYPYQSQEPFFNPAIEELDRRNEAFLPSPEKQASICLAELFHKLSEEERSFWFVKRLLLNREQKWGVLEDRIAAALSARLIGKNLSEFKEFLKGIDKDHQERVIVEAARAIAIDFKRTSGGSIHYHNFGLLIPFIKNIEFKKRTPKTQLALIKMLIRITAAEALAFMEEMEEGREKNIARIEMVYYFHRVLLFDALLPARNRTTYIGLLAEAQLLSPDLLEKRVGRVVPKYLTLLADRGNDLTTLVENQPGNYTLYRLQEKEEELMRSIALVEVGKKICTLFEKEAELALEEEILEFFKEFKAVHFFIEHEVAEVFFDLFRYIKKEEVALEALNCILKVTMQGCMVAYLYDDLAFLAKQFILSLDRCSLEIQNSTKCLLKIADILDAITPMKAQLGMLLREKKGAGIYTEKAEALTHFLPFACRRMEGVAAFLRLLELAQKEGMEFLYYDFFLPKLGDLIANRATQEEILSFASYKGYQTPVIVFTLWRFLIEVGMIDKKEVFNRIRRIEKDTTRDQAIVEILKVHSPYIENTFFSNKELLMLADEITNMELKCEYKKKLLPEEKFAQEFIEELFLLPTR